MVRNTAKKIFDSSATRMETRAMCRQAFKNPGAANTILREEAYGSTVKSALKRAGDLGKKFNSAFKKLYL